MAELEPVIPNLPQEEPLPLPQHFPGLNVRPSRQPIAIEGKEATNYDFLSLGRSNSASSSVDVAPNVLQASMTAQDLLHPPQKAVRSGNVLPAALVHGNTKPHISYSDYNAGRQTNYILVNEGVEMQSNYRTSDISHVPKAHSPHDVSNNKQWQQQTKKRLSWVVPENDDDEDDECLDPDHNFKKEIGYQKFKNLQQPERKTMVSKGLTLRSKHSATEQRRRSKINDRFEMIRQLLPYSEQKRNMASFLLEVIEHIQMLHEKVNKYEAAEHLGQPHKKPKALPWDRTSGCKEGATDAGKPVMYNIKDKPDENGFMSYPSSPVRVSHRNSNAQIEPLSNGAHAYPFPKRPLQASACLLSCGNSSIISTPAVLTSATPPGIYGEEPVTPTMIPSSSQSLPEPQTVYAQLVNEEKQAAIRGKHTQSHEKTMALSDLHQAGISMSAQKSSFLCENDCEKPKILEQNRPVVCRDWRTNGHELDEQLRSSPVKDMYQRTSNSIPNECKVDKGRTSYGIDGMPMDVNVKGPKETLRCDVVAYGQAQSASFSGSVNVSIPYSQGLLDSLTRALQSSGVDLSQASISVQIDLGKASGSAFTSSREIATLNAEMLPSQTSNHSHSEEPEYPITKRPKIEAGS